MFLKSMADWTTSEQCEEIRELKTNIALQDSLNDTEKSLGRVTLSLDRSESPVKRLSQQIRESLNLPKMRCRDELSTVV